MPLKSTLLVPEIITAEIVMLSNLPVRKLRMKLLQHPLAFREISVRRQPHRFPFAIAMPPAQRFRHVAVEPTQRCRWRETFQLLDPSILSPPNADRNPVPHPIERHDELLLL